MKGTFRILGLSVAYKIGEPNYKLKVVKRFKTPLQKRNRAVREIKEYKCDCCGNVGDSDNLKVVGDSVFCNDCVNKILSEHIKKEETLKQIYKANDIENEGIERQGQLLVYPNWHCVLIDFDKDGNELSWDVVADSVRRL